MGAAVHSIMSFNVFANADNVAPPGNLLLPILGVGILHGSSSGRAPGRKYKFVGGVGLLLWLVGLLLIVVVVVVVLFLLMMLGQ